MKTGVFFHPEFAKGDWPIIGNKYRNFPGVMKDILTMERVKLFESKPVAESLLLKIHTEFHLKEVKGAWYYRGASLPQTFSFDRLRRPQKFSTSCGKDDISSLLMEDIFWTLQNISFPRFWRSL